MSEINAKDFVDITDVVCPITFVKAKIAIEDLEEGEILEIKMNEGEPLLNVPRSLKEEGHKVISITNNEDGTFTLYVVKDGIK